MLRAKKKRNFWRKKTEIDSSFPYITSELINQINPILFDNKKEYDDYALITPYLIEMVKKIQPEILKIKVPQCINSNAILSKFIVAKIDQKHKPIFFDKEDKALVVTSNEINCFKHDYYSLDYNVHKLIKNKVVKNAFLYMFQVSFELFIKKFYGFNNYEEYIEQLNTTLFEHYMFDSDYADFIDDNKEDMDSERLLEAEIYADNYFCFATNFKRALDHVYQTSYDDAVKYFDWYQKAKNRYKPQTNYRDLLDGLFHCLSNPFDQIMEQGYRGSDDGDYTYSIFSFDFGPDNVPYMDNIRENIYQCKNNEHNCVMYDWKRIRFNEKKYVFERPEINLDIHISLWLDEYTKIINYGS